MDIFVYSVSNDDDVLTIKETWCECDVVEEYCVGGKWTTNCPKNLKYLDDIVVKNYSDIVMKELTKEANGDDCDEDCLSHLGLDFVVHSYTYRGD